MTRTKIAVIIGIITLAITSADYFFGIQTISAVEYELNQAVSYLNKGDEQRSKVHTKKAEENWNKSSNIIMFFNTHEKTDDIDISLNAAVTDITYHYTDLFREEVQKTLVLLKHMREAEYPLPENLL